MIQRLIAAVFLFWWTMPVAAGEITARIDPESTTVTFRLQATLHSVDGTLSMRSGEIVMDVDLGTAEGSIMVDAASAATGNSKRDRKMHRQVLQSASHPHLVLRVRSFEGELVAEGESEISVNGEIEILGQPHGISIPMVVEIVGSRFTATATFEVPYVQWGLEDPSTFLLRVAKIVDVTVVAKGTVEKGDAQLPDPS